MPRRHITFAALILASWVVMTFTHELGHIIGGACCGATLTEFDLAPWRLPYSLHSPDPHPLVTLWAGPLLGIGIPLVAAALIGKRWAWFIADFCLMANGGYLALAWLSGDRFLDTPRLLDAGAHPATIVLYCVLSIGLGYTWFRSDCIHYLTLSPIHRFQTAENHAIHRSGSDTFSDG